MESREKPTSAWYKNESFILEASGKCLICERRCALMSRIGNPSPYRALKPAERTDNGILPHYTCDKRYVSSLNRNSQTSGSVSYSSLYLLSATRSQEAFD